MIMEKIASGAAVNLLKKPIEKLYQLAEDKIIKHYTKWNLPENLSLAPVALENIRTIKTICNRSAGVNLFDIYYSAKIETASGKKLPCTMLSELVDYSGTQNIMICGVAGQGKSVFLRYLWVNEIEQGDFIPILINLRDINAKDINLKNLIFSSLATLGLNIDKDDVALDALLSSGIVKIFLDGLDEVNRENILALKHEIIDLISKYSSTSVIISSRPGALIDYIKEIPTFKQLNIAKIDESDFFDFLVKIGTSADIAKKLVDSVKGKGIKTVIDTPLMLTLLVQVYGSRETIPENLPDLYREMFHILAHTHDETKPGYVRQWATGLSTGEISSLFEAFSYASIESASSSLSEDQFNEAHKTSKEITGLSCTSIGFKTDMVESICLMAREGINTAYVHRSIQEFYSAFFLSHEKDDEFIEEFYNSISGISRLLRFENTLGFLGQIDGERYVRYFLKPQWDDFKMEHCGGGESNNSEILQSVFGKYHASNFDSAEIKFFELQIIKMVLTHAELGSDMKIAGVDLDASTRLLESYKTHTEKRIAASEKQSSRKQKKLFSMLSKTKPGVK